MSAQPQNLKLQIALRRQGPHLPSTMTDCLVVTEDGDVLGRLPSMGFSMNGDANNPVTASIDLYEHRIELVDA